MSDVTWWSKPKLFLVATVLALCTAMGLHGTAHVTAQTAPSRAASRVAFTAAAKSAENGTITFNGVTYPTYDHDKLAQVPGVRTGRISNTGKPIASADLNHAAHLSYNPLKGASRESLDQTTYGGYGVNSSYLYGWWFQQYAGGPYVLEEIYGRGDSYIATGYGNIYNWDYAYSDVVGSAGSQGEGHGYSIQILGQYYNVHATVNSYTLPALPGVCYWSRAYGEIIFTNGTIQYPASNASFTYCDS